MLKGVVADEVEGDLGLYGHVKEGFYPLFSFPMAMDHTITRL